MTGPLKKLRENIVAEMVTRGASKADADKVVGTIGDGAILTFLLSHLGDLSALITLLMSLLKGGK
jgi:hypothetical protein